MKRLHIFKPGKHIAMDGSRIEFTEEMVKASAAAYNPELHEAPMVIGHPKTDAPAYGWVKGLAFDEGGLHADPDQVDPAFADMVASGRFKKRSASFYPPDDPRNPVPGTYYLKHVGFLGAQPPAVKGLKAVGFADDQEAVTVEFGDWNDQTVARVLRKIKNFFIEQFGKEQADQVIDEWELEDLSREALKPSPVAPAEPEFAENPRKEQIMTPEEIAKKEKELNDQEASFAEREQQLKAREQQARREKDVAFVESLVKAGKLLPRHKGFAVNFLEKIAGDSAETITVSFAEGTEKTLDVRAAFCEFLEDLGSHPLFKEMTKPATDKQDGDAAFAEGLTGHV